MRATPLAVLMLLSVLPPASGADIGGSCRDGVPYRVDDATLPDAIRASRNAGRMREAEALRVFAIAHQYYWRAESACNTMTLLHPPTEAQEHARVAHAAAGARAVLLAHRTLWRPMCRALIEIVAKPERHGSTVTNSALEAAVVLDGRRQPWCSPKVMSALVAGDDGSFPLEIAKGECVRRREPHCERIARP